MVTETAPLDGTPSTPATCNTSGSTDCAASRSLPETPSALRVSRIRFGGRETKPAKASGEYQVETSASRSVVAVVNKQTVPLSLSFTVTRFGMS